MNRLFTTLVLVFVSLYAAGQDTQILTQQEQAKVIDAILEERLRALLPTLMRREGIDMWVLVSREYHEDPVMKTMLPAQWMAARRTTMLVIFDSGPEKGIEYLAVSRYDVGTSTSSRGHRPRVRDGARVGSIMQNISRARRQGR